MPRPLSPEAALLSSFRFLNNSKLSDVAVYLGPDQIKIDAHRLILSVTSPYFDDLFSGGFKEGQEREVRFENYSTHALWRVFEYMYKKTYSDEITEVPGTKSS